MWTAVFQQKPEFGVYVFDRRVFHHLLGDYSLEDQLFKKLSQMDQMHVYQHEGFWIPVETVRDRCDMENLWNAGMAPWKIWE